MKNLITFLLVFIASTVCAQTYCAPPFTATTTGCINSVKFGTLYNSDPCSGGFGYLYSGAAPTFYRDSTYTLELVFDSITTPTWVAIAIPFDTGVGKYTFTTTNRYYNTLSLFPTAPHTYRLPITIPHDAALGSTRLRVVRHKSSGIPHICNDGLPTSTHGESQDYTLNIGNIPPPNITLSVPTISKSTIYPNPTDGIIHIPYGTATITNSLGQIVYTAAETSVIDITQLPAATYYLKTGGTFTVVVKQ